MAAKRSGIAVSGCEACHDASGAELSLTAEPSVFGPGASITLILSVRRASGSLTAAGAYVPDPRVGQLSVLSGEGLVLIAPEGLAHAQPKSADAGLVSFRFGWRAPAQPGAVRLRAFALATNGDGASGGDVAGVAQLDLAYGCVLHEFAYDLDGDGFGNARFPTGVGCAGDTPPPGYAAEASDCDENDPEIHPGAFERCNGKDDDCDAQIDEGAALVPLWPDEDGDGYYAAMSGVPKQGCSGVAGYASQRGDCAPRDPAVHPGAIELCNSVDDNCDARVDERVRPQCGEGLCRRESTSCDASDCTPGQPVAERCNGLDDDCDGLLDEDAECGPGLSCVGGACVRQASVTPPRAGSSGDAAGALAHGGARTSGAANATRGGAASSSSSGKESAPDPHDEPARAEPSCAVGRCSRADAWLSVLALGAALWRRLRQRQNPEAEP